jgi:hypothetical protein
VISASVLGEIARRHLPAEFFNGVLSAARAGHLHLLELSEVTYRPNWL